MVCHAGADALDLDEPHGLTIPQDDPVGGREHPLVRRMTHRAIDAVGPDHVGHGERLRRVEVRGVEIRDDGLDRVAQPHGGGLFDGHETPLDQPYVERGLVGR